MILIAHPTSWGYECMRNPIYPNSDEEIPRDTLTAQWGVRRGAGMFEIPWEHLNSFWSCIYICIRLLNIHTSDPAVELLNPYQEGTLECVVISSSALEAGDITDLMTPIPNVWLSPASPIIFRFFSNDGHCGWIEINNEVLSLRLFLHSAQEIHFWLDIGLIWYPRRSVWPEQTSRSLYSTRLTLRTFLAHDVQSFTFAKCGICPKTSL